MTVYFLLALAVSALSAVVEAPLLKPAARVAASSEVRSERRGRLVRAVRDGRESRPVVLAASTVERADKTPLTGAATPRAPSTLS